MNIQSTRFSAQAPQRKRPDFGQGIPGYTGPEDGLSHPRFQGLVKKANQLMIAGAYRLELENEENFPHQGPQVYAPTHPSMFDPPLVASLSNRDLRYLANVYVFDGFRGKVMTWGGAFPVHRDEPRFTTKRHAVDLIREGKGFVIFPEGGIADPQEHGQVGPLMKGAAKLAILGEAESVVPIATDYQPDRKERKREKLWGGMASAGVLAGGLVSALGGPVARTVGGALTGALAGGYLVGKINRNLTDNPEWFDPFPKYFATANGGLLGAAIGGALGAVAGVALPADASRLAVGSLAVGAASSTVKIAEGIRTRPIARVRIGEPLKVKDYTDRHATTGEAADEMTLDLHRAMSREKKALNGVEQAEPSFRGKVVETLKTTDGTLPPQPVAGPNKLRATFQYGAKPVLGGLATGLASAALASALGAGPPALFGTAGAIVGLASGALASLSDSEKARSLPPEAR